MLENTDYRPFKNKKKKNYNNLNESNGSVEIDEAIAYFKINDDLTINKYYCTEHKPLPFKETHGIGDEITKENNKFRWSSGISNMYKKNDNEYFILVAISRVDIDEDMKGTKEMNNIKLDYRREYLSSKTFKCSSSPDCKLNENNKFDEAYDTTVVIQPEPNSDDNIPKQTNEIKKGVAIYRLELTKNHNEENKEKEKGENKGYILNAVTRYYSDKISGICRFIEVSDDDDKDKSRVTEQRRFIILNFRGIYNFEFNDHFNYFNLNEKFEYPQSVRHELDDWFTRTDDCDDCDACMKRLISCIYNKYFLVTQYKNDVQLLEGKKIVHLLNIIKKFVLI
jgi:hypothetical protein